MKLESSSNREETVAASRRVMITAKKDAPCYFQQRVSICSYFIPIYSFNIHARFTSPD